MIEKLENYLTKYSEINNELSTLDIAKNQERYLELTKEHSALSEVVEKIIEYKVILSDISEYEKAIHNNDEELKEMALEELPGLQIKKTTTEEEIRIILLPTDPNDEKNVILEIRAGTGGDEAAIFAADLFRMYMRYAELQKWKMSIISSNEIGVGGYKEII